MLNTHTRTWSWWISSML